MKGIYRIYGIAIAFLALWTIINADAPTKCPYPTEEFPENTTTNIPHETKCTKFYKCFHGRGIEQNCPLMIPNDKTSRLHYNREKQVCDWPWEAGCHVCPLKVNGRWPNAKLPSNDDCSKYYECKNGIPKVKYCPSNTCFSRTCQNCVENRKGGYCDLSEPSEPSDSSESIESTKPPICKHGAKKSHECYCALYYDCIDNLGWVQERCPSGLHFSPMRQRCMDPDVAGCRSKNQ